MTRLAVVDSEIDAVWLGTNAAGHGWRLVVTLKSGASQVINFDDVQIAIEAFDYFVAALDELHGLAGRTVVHS